MEAILLVKNRFFMNKSICLQYDWDDIERKIMENDILKRTIELMEETGGEPEVFSYDSISNQYIIVDCSKESPIGRRSLCYDRSAWVSRKVHKPIGSAMEIAESMGVLMLNEEMYRQLQTYKPCDEKTSSWILTPKEVRMLGGAIFGDRRYNRTFFYHNGVESYYASRGFRGMVLV